MRLWPIAGPDRMPYQPDDGHALTGGKQGDFADSTIASQIAATERPLITPANGGDSDMMTAIIRIRHAISMSWRLAPRRT